MPRRRRSAGEDQEWVEERRVQILRAAAAVFASRGFHRARLQDIADGAGVAAGTIYNYFGGKEDLLVALLKMVVADSDTTSIADVRADGDAAGWLTSLLNARLDILERNWQLIHAVGPEMIAHASLRQEYLDEVVQPMLQQFAPLLEEYVAAGHVRPFNPRVVLPALAGAVLGAFAASNYAGWQPATATRAEIVDELRTFILDGLRQPGTAPETASPSGARLGGTPARSRRRR